MNWEYGNTIVYIDNTLIKIKLNFMFLITHYRPILDIEKRTWKHGQLNWGPGYSCDI